jgi:hypothetical protein
MIALGFLIIVDNTIHPSQVEWYRTRTIAGMRRLSAHLSRTSFQLN